MRPVGCFFGLIGFGKRIIAVFSCFRLDIVAPTAAAAGGGRTARRRRLFCSHILLIEPDNALRLTFERGPAVIFFHFAECHGTRLIDRFGFGLCGCFWAARHDFW